jgi:hypothetical protein
MLYALYVCPVHYLQQQCCVASSTFHSSCKTSLSRCLPYVGSHLLRGRLQLSSNSC